MVKKTDTDKMEKIPHDREGAERYFTG